MKKVLTLAFLLVFSGAGANAFAVSFSFAKTDRGFMIGAPADEKQDTEEEEPVIARPLPPQKNNKPIIAAPQVEKTEQESTLPEITAVYTPPPQRSAQNIAIHAGLPTFVSTYYNPTSELLNVSWATALTSGLVGGLIGMGAEIYDEWSMENAISTKRVVQTGGLLGAATTTGVIISQSVQRSLLLNSSVLWGASSTATSSQVISGLVSDTLGSGAASVVYASGAYAMGWVDPADARTAIAKGATGSLIMATGKAAGTQALFSAVGTTGTAATLGPYAVTYLAAVGAIYLTEVIFDQMDKNEERDRLKKMLGSYR